MKSESSFIHELTTPQFIDLAAHLNGILRHMDHHELARLMEINDALANAVKDQADTWNSKTVGTAAALTFRGDIYSGLAAAQWSKDDAIFAQQHLLILSGLYGLLKPFDAIKPYRLEMGYKLKLQGGQTLEKFWEQHMAHTLDASDTYVNLTAKEYFNAIKRQLAESTVISPKFLTVSEKTGLPTFVTVHTKIARGSFANWMIKNKVTDPNKLKDYSELNYEFNESLSTASQPVFICRTFGGLGLSVRLK